MGTNAAFIYPGQGAQAVGMGVSLVDTFPEAAAVFDCASEIVGYDLLDLCANGPMDTLSQTKFTQPALYTVEAAITDILRSRGVTPACAAGHSLGEFAAWYAAEVYSFEDGLRIVTARGRIMDAVDPDGKGTMQAVIGLDRAVIDETLEAVEGTVVTANINAPGQMIISGEKDAVTKAGDLLKEKGAKRVLPLKVGGAFHSPLMEAARDEFADVVAGMMFADASIPVYANVTAGPVTAAAEIRSLMVEQLTSPVRWIETVASMAAGGIDRAYEIGPGSVLSGLIRRIDRSMTVVSVGDSDAIEEATA